MCIIWLVTDNGIISRSVCVPCKCVHPRWYTHGSGPLFHDDVIKWKHFPCYWSFVWGIHRSPVNSPHKRQWREALMFSLIFVWTNTWANNGEAGVLRRHRVRYNLIVMSRERRRFVGIGKPLINLRWYDNSAYGIFLVNRGPGFVDIYWVLKLSRRGLWQQCYRDACEM